MFLSELIRKNRCGDKSVTVIDNGRVVLVGIHLVKKKSGVEIVFTELHLKISKENLGIEAITTI